MTPLSTLPLRHLFDFNSSLHVDLRIRLFVILLSTLLPTFFSSTVPTSSTVIDVHQSWSGPCESMTPTFARLMLETDRSTSRLLLLSCALPLLTSSVQSLQTDDAKFGDLSHKGCAPLFVAVRFGKAVGMVQGANSPALVALIKEQIPNLKEDEEGN